MLRAGLLSLLLLLSMVVQAVPDVVTSAPPLSDQANTQTTGPTKIIEQKSRGQLLYENNCTTCHESLIHIREKHKARSPDMIRDFVSRWAGEINQDWDSNEIEDVVQYLNQRYYKFEMSQ